MYLERFLITMEIRTQYVSDGTPQEFISSAISRIYKPIYRFTASSPMPVVGYGRKENLFHESDQRVIRNRISLVDPKWEKVSNDAFSLSEKTVEKTQ